MGGGVPSCCLQEQCAGGLAGKHLPLPRPIWPAPRQEGQPLTVTTQGHWSSKATHPTLQGKIPAGLQVTGQREACDTWAKDVPSLASVCSSAKWGH